MDGRCGSKINSVGWALALELLTNAHPCVCVYMYVHYVNQPYLHSDWSVRHSGPLHHRAEPTVLKSPDPLSPFEEWGLGMRLP